VGLVPVVENVVVEGDGAAAGNDDLGPGVIGHVAEDIGEAAAEIIRPLAI